MKRYPQILLKKKQWSITKLYSDFHEPTSQLAKLNTTLAVSANQ
jgi:hypothetical protein